MLESVWQCFGYWRTIVISVENGCRGAEQYGTPLWTKIRSGQGGVAETLNRDRDSHTQTLAKCELRSANCKAQSAKLRTANCEAKRDCTSL